MTIQEIHYSIENNLQELGSYYYGDYEPEQIDDALNAILFKIINKASSVTSADLKGLNAAEKLIFSGLIDEVCSVPDKEESLFYVDLGTETNVQVVSVLTYDVKCKKPVTSSTLTAKKYYRTKTDVKYKGTWYKKCSFFQADASDLTYYGTVEEIPVERVAASPVSFNQLDSLAGRFTTPLWTNRGNKLYLTYNKPVVSICYSYVKNFAGGIVSYCNNVTIPFNETIQRYIIELVVQRLAVRSGEEQQKVMNLKTENLE